MAKTSHMFLEGMALSARLLDGRSVPLLIERVNLDQVAQEVIACGKLACSSTRQVRYVVEIDPEIEETVYCDLNCVSRNLMNLVANAAKHTAQGSITVHMTLELMRTQIVVAVKDTGVGILDEMKETVFDPFVSMDGSTGLGLYVVRMQSEAMGGSCGIRDNPDGHGAEVWFRIPYITRESDVVSRLGPNCHIRHNVDDPQGGIKVFGAVDGNKPIKIWEGNRRREGDDGDASNEGVTHDNVDLREMKGGSSCSHGERATPRSILLIDDNLSLLQVHAAELRQEGYAVTTAQGAVQGLEFLKLHVYSLVLVDIKMPVLNGDELVAAFLHWENHNRPMQRQKIYALSAYTSHDVQERCELVGMEGVIAKPLVINVIVDLLQQSHE